MQGTIATLKYVKFTDSKGSIIKKKTVLFYPLNCTLEDEAHRAGMKVSMGTLSQ